MKLSPLAFALLAACTSAPTTPDAQDLARQLLRDSFRAEGSARLDRLVQDDLQKACSGRQPLPAREARRLEAAQLAAVTWPSDGVFIGDWRRGEALAQSGRGMSWSDPVGTPSGGGCYNCHQISREEISFGTLGPSLFQYGRRRGIGEPDAPAAKSVVAYTWAKLWNAKAYQACSLMPRFGHEGVLSEAQIKDLMALLLDPGSPVNAP